MQIADNLFVIRSDCWGYLREAENLERRLNQDITAGKLTETIAAQMFYVHARGHLASWHNPRTGIVSLPWDPSPAETGPGPASAAESGFWMKKPHTNSTANVTTTNIMNDARHAPACAGV